MATAASPFEDYTLNSTEAAKRIRIPLSTMHRWARGNVIDYAVDHRGWRWFKPADADAVRENREQIRQLFAMRG